MIKIQKENFSISQENKKLFKKNVGAIVNFIGIARGGGNKKKIFSIEIEHYPKMAKKKIKEIETIAKKRWKLIDCIIIHRYGKIKSGSNIVYVATAAEHRKNAFEACEFIIDYLKTNAPFWKKEITNVDENYVSSNKRDLNKLKKWNI